MPTYDRECIAGCGDFEVFTSISRCDDPQPCPGCGGPSKKVLLSAPFLNNPDVRILDYPGSKRLKAGYVHSHGTKPVTKTSVGYGGAINPSTAPKHPIVDMVRPDPLRFKKPSGL